MISVSPGAPHAGFPILRSRLIGREADRTAAGAILRDNEVALLTLIGPGGVGKTRLALSLAQDLTSAFRDGVHWVDLAPERDPDRVLPLIAEALGLYDMGGTPVRERLIDALRQRQTLIVLDNVEHLLPAAPDLADLLRHCPTLTLLATSRVPLRLSLERLLPLAPLHTIRKVGEVGRLAG